MRNFVVGVIVGASAVYWYLHTDVLRDAVADLWAQVSAPPATARRAKP
jgi:hypothetical protein